MIALAVLLAVAAACILGAPRLLVLAGFALRRPRLTLVLWLTVFGLGAAAVLASVLWTAMLVVAFRTTALDVGWVAGIVAWLALTAGGGAAAVVLVRAEPFLAERSAVDRRVDLLTAACVYRVEQAGAAQVLFIRAARPVAFSSRADGGRVVVTEAMEQLLDPGQLAAVVAHERAHLAGRHDVLLRIAGVNRACLPGFFGARAFDRAVHLLIELVADDVAADECGRQTLAAALDAIGSREQNEWAAVRASRLRIAPAARTARLPRPT